MWISCVVYIDLSFHRGLFLTMVSVYASPFFPMDTFCTVHIG